MQTVGVLSISSLQTIIDFKGEVLFLVSWGFFKQVKCLHELSATHMTGGLCPNWFVSVSGELEMLPDDGLDPITMISMEKNYISNQPC